VAGNGLDVHHTDESAEKRVKLGAALAQVPVRSSRQEVLLATAVTAAPQVTVIDVVVVTAEGVDWHVKSFDNGLQRIQVSYCKCPALAKILSVPAVE